MKGWGPSACTGVFREGWRRGAGIGVVGSRVFDVERENKIFALNRSTKVWDWMTKCVAGGGGWLHRCLENGGEEQGALDLGSRPALGGVTEEGYLTGTAFAS